MAEQVDAADLKFVALWGVPVRSRPPAPAKNSYPTPFFCCALRYFFQPPSLFSFSVVIGAMVCIAVAIRGHCCPADIIAGPADVIAASPTLLSFHQPPGGSTGAAYFESRTPQWGQAAQSRLMSYSLVSHGGVCRHSTPPTTVILAPPSFPASPPSFPRSGNPWLTAMGVSAVHSTPPPPSSPPPPSFPASPPNPWLTAMGGVCRHSMAPASASSPPPRHSDAKAGIHGLTPHGGVCRHSTPPTTVIPRPPRHSRESGNPWLTIAHNVSRLSCCVAFHAPTTVIPLPHPPSFPRKRGIHG